MDDKEKYPNGLEAWLETFYQISIMIHHYFDNHLNDPIDCEIKECQSRYGINGLFLLSKEWATEFESKYSYETWEIFDFYETLEAFIEEKNKRQ